MIGSQVDQRVLSELLVRKAPNLAAHFRELNLFQEVISTSWFLAVYTTTLVPQVTQRKKKKIVKKKNSKKK